VHGQLYGYNDLILDPLRKLVGDAVYPLGRTAAFLFERLMIGMVYLHSDDSGTLKLDVNPDSGHASLGRIQGVEDSKSEVVLDEYMSKLKASRRELGGRPFRILTRRNPPGLSQHFGSSLPMKRERDRWSTDPYGRPWSCERTHCVDSSVLPSIPGTPTALILMANAMRIADQSRSL
jgi:choline dehydrogenase-like flavoprotein